ncbi:hypothetical protein RHOFW510R12_00880 [Rhodanobacter sp. FW510-R12]
MTFEEVYELVGLSIDLRLREAVGNAPPLSDHDAWLIDRTSHPFVVLNDQVADGMRRAGRRGRSTGQDLRESPFWPLLEHRSSYVEAYERLRPIDVDQISCDVIHEHLVNRGNTVRWRGWIARIGSASLVDDDYGHPTMERSYRVYDPAGAKHVVPASTDDPSQDIFMLMTGCGEPDWVSPLERATL